MSATEAAVRAWLLDVLLQKSPRTRETYCHAVGKLWAWLEAQSLPTQLDAIKPAHVRAFYASLPKRSIAHYDRMLRAVFKRLAAQGAEDFGLSENWHSPFDKIERVQAKPPVKSPLTPEQVGTLLAAQPRRGFVAMRNHAELATLCMTGIRVSELLALELRDVNLTQRTLLVRHGKGDKTRVVYLPAKLVRILLVYTARLGDRGPLLFPTRDGKAQTRRSVHRTVQCAGRKAGIPGLHPHLLRHTYASVALNVRGAPIRFVQEQLGHEDIATTMRYNHTFADRGAKLADDFSVL